MRRLSVSESSFDAVVEVLARPAQDLSRYRERARSVIEQIKLNGDAALIDLTEKFDGVRLAQIRVSEQDIKAAVGQLGAETKKALVSAARNIRRFHRRTMQVPEQSVGIRPGVSCRKVVRPLDSVGLYVPGGSAPLVSTLLMLAIPAQLAGVKRIAVATPPRVHPAILAACALLGLEEVYQVGGSQAVAALAYGTESVEPVAKIAGPGNIWVTAAKAEVAADPNGAAIDLLAGPSELMVIADDRAQARSVAADLLSQAEHDELSRVVLLSPSPDLIATVEREVVRQVEGLPRREIAGRCLEASWLVQVSDLDEAVRLANEWAPEHLSIQTRDPEALLNRVRNAGSVFLGAFSPEAAGDYCSGPNHVLPTGGAARSSDGVSVSTFQKSMTVQSISREGLKELERTVVTLARLEGLEAHARAVESRLQEVP